MSNRCDRCSRFCAEGLVSVALRDESRVHLCSSCHFKSATVGASVENLPGRPAKAPARQLSRTESWKNALGFTKPSSK